ncbi:hypothetical protein [Cysteiniphilum marinum]|uniref:hypothetical protein n=1 Tax=Cysteiniphilum marinum TaxID=2774191 RepID=UPI00193A8B15|nr:hypothetical protein [Cysteiniphilum marinum]
MKKYKIIVDYETKNTGTYTYEVEASNKFEAANKVLHGDIDYIDNEPDDCDIVSLNIDSIWEIKDEVNSNR